MYRTAMGDPGFLGNLFRGVVGTVGGAVKGFITGGPAGAVVGAARGAGSATRMNIAASTLDATAPIGGSNFATPHPHYVPGYGVVSQPGYHHVGGKVVGTRSASQAVAGPGAAPALLPAGVPGGGGGRRRMNWANVRALGRAERRIHSAVKHMTKYIRWVSPSKKGHAAPRFKRKRK